MNKDGDWIGTPVTVERSVNDLVLVDNALNDSMLGPRTTVTKKDELQQKENAPNDDGNGGINESKTSNDDGDAVTTTIIPVSDSITIEANLNMNAITAKDSEPSEDPEPATVVNKNDDTNGRINDEKTDSKNKARRSSRKRIQRMTIESDDIGDCDTENDPDYKS